MLFLLFFFKQKTAYEMRISDWSSDVCSSDLSLQIADDVPIRVENADRRNRCFRKLLLPAGFAQQALRRELGCRVVVLVPQQRDLGWPHLRDTLVRRRSEESRVGKEYVSKCRSRRSPDH